ncbi:hypothetical protein FMUND_8785 [Fusarium mundagurra]|uniref:Uncharacterized protein n=1 Tax=Fusarium mundagurra TaxID=1567541 RepID=A0A8H5YGH7_9HYPO|nr:hypothetical protein FMUND_8785 [Fusarium mundagurra]
MDVAADSIVVSPEDLRPRDLSACKSDRPRRLTAKGIKTLSGNVGVVMRVLVREIRDETMKQMVKAQEEKVKEITSSHERIVETLWNVLYNFIGGGGLQLSRFQFLDYAIIAKSAQKDIVRLQKEKLELEVRRTGTLRRIRNPDGGAYTIRQLREMVPDRALLLAQVIVVFPSFHPDNSHCAPRIDSISTKNLGRGAIISSHIPEIIGQAMNDLTEMSQYQQHAKKKP